VIDGINDDAGAVVGVIADTCHGQIKVGANRGVVFATGGMEHNAELRARFLRGPIVGTCGAASNRGDFVAIAERLGSELVNMGEGWWAQLPLEPCLDSFEQGDLITQNHGDSMIVVSAAGVRVVNEKQSYNERAKAHFVRDERCEYPNRLLIQIFDEAVYADTTPWPMRWPIPEAGEHAGYLLRGDTLEQLTQAISMRLLQLSDRTGGFALAPDFLVNLERSISRFNGFADTGIDEDFGRGATEPERFFSAEVRPGPKPNPTMYPFSARGPYYAIVLGASTLGTKGGPRINRRLRYSPRSSLTKWAFARSL
jgi:hypothetical protein